MPDDEISYVWRMACFCYGLSYSPQKAAVDNVWISAAHTHAMVYSLGDKYAVNGLQEYASLRFETELKKALSSAFWAARRDGSNLQDAVGKALEGFDETVKAVYTTTPDSDRALRDIIVAFINEKWKMSSMRSKRRRESALSLDPEDSNESSRLYEAFKPDDYCPGVYSLGPQQELFDALGQLLRTGYNSDITIVCQGYSVDVHEILITCRSTYFQNMLANDLRLSEEDPEMIEKVVSYLYHLDYKPQVSCWLTQEHLKDSDLEIHAEMFYLGHYLGIDGLMCLAFWRMKAWLEKKSNAKRQKSFRPSALNAFIKATHIIWEKISTNCKNVRDLMLDFVPENYAALKEMKAFAELITEVNGFAADWIFFDMKTCDTPVYQRLKSCEV
ncbi:uncharacterized protein KY384_001373 [Bacidia gigantensis]|uniref:uncharacterized protein n=1 Tax=Bacidia gigantensis TaxID=2732470 RepID=UPI001D056B57|nr:uncharacterized protein KY384_001373 [Bacidia gigantensis]KAG8533632.1 hypothetical protein KY384_001373 [Bacidia gigantensis]